MSAEGHDWEEALDADEYGRFVYFQCRRCLATTTATLHAGAGYQPDERTDDQYGCPVVCRR